MGKAIAYRHHDKLVMVDEELKGRHRSHSLCYACIRFNPEDRPGNCVLAEKVEDISRELGLVLPVWECPAFIEGEPKSVTKPEYPEPAAPPKNPAILPAEEG